MGEIYFMPLADRTERQGKKQLVAVALVRFFRSEPMNESE